MDTYMNRTIDAFLKEWASAPSHKPLLLRGARQVGKTTAVRHLALALGMELVEIDLARRVDLHAVFADPARSPREICQDLSILLGKDIVAGKTLLFLDEIQACPAAIEMLRYFWELLPEQHVVAAGSLLEFALRKTANFGVGRIRSLFMHAMGFQEFLPAIGETRLLQAIGNADPAHPLSDAVHQKALSLFKVFLLIGGLPEVVRVYRDTRDLGECMRVLDDLVLSYQDDFSKYQTRSPVLRLRDVFRSVSRQGQDKFVYSHVAEGVRSESARDALELLLLAGIVIPITHSNANGLPLGAETNSKYRRISYMDTGILFRMLNLDLRQWSLDQVSELCARGAAAETFVAAELAKSANPAHRPELYCWHNESKNANAKLAFVIERDGKVVPVEVKSGTRGSMKSLWVFLQKRADNPNVSDHGIRLSMENFGACEGIRVYPLYAVWRL